ncbi:GFA family protein [Oceanibium sediminis]|uniref:GFA family protein n=1 Tax=Oceanibium sediminis TaxID=2026339 RepID=UPI000DD30E47|nr:GFA family protein [Oceanibium sediminis]
MTSPSKGSCLCGAIVFEITGDFKHFFLCHCGRCRKGTGSAHAANLFAPGGQLTWISGEAEVRSFQLPGTAHARSFCATCGAALPGVQMGGKVLVVPAGSLDTPVAARAEARICWASRADWDEGLDSIPKLDGLPGA